MTRLYIVSSIFCIFFISACSGKQVKIDPKAPVAIQIPDYSPTRTEIRSAIIAASHSLGWNARDRAPGVLHVTHKIRGRESITLEVDFSDSNYTINYQGSSRKAYSAESGKIHPYFESFAEELHLAIKDQLPKITEPEPNITVKPNVSINFDNTAVADKKNREEILEKLEEEKRLKEERKERIARITRGEDQGKAVEVIGRKEKSGAHANTKSQPAQDTQVSGTHESPITLYDVEQESPSSPQVNIQENTENTEKTDLEVPEAPQENTAAQDTVKVQEQDAVPASTMTIKDLTPQDNAKPAAQKPTRRREATKTRKVEDAAVSEKNDEKEQEKNSDQPNIAPMVDEGE